MKRTPYGHYEEEYRGLVIFRGLYGGDEYVVSYCGDDIYCESYEHAKKTIDEIIEYENTH